MFGGDSPLNVQAVGEWRKQGRICPVSHGLGIARAFLFYQQGVRYGYRSSR